MKKLATYVVAGVALIAAPAFAADMAVKAPPQQPPPAPVPTWTGFYGGIQFGGGWSDEPVNYSANDILSAILLSGGGASFFLGGSGVVSGYRIPQSGPVGGFETGYNWQWSNWLLGVETDFSFAGMSGTASGTSRPVFSSFTQTATATQETDWYGTIRGRVRWLPTPNLLLFGTGGFAYGRVANSVNYAVNGPIFPQFLGISGGLSFLCTASGVTCFAGSSSEIRTGWTAGGGAEWLLDQHWSAKVEYQLYL
jgi:outer membrane immunogenic protein